MLLIVLLMFPEESCSHIPPPLPTSQRRGFSPLCLHLSHSTGGRLKLPSHPLDPASGHPTESSATSTRTWTSGRDEPPAQDTLIPPPTAGRACPPHSPARLTTTTALVRKEEAPKWAGRARGTTQWLDVPSYRTEQGFPEISITVWPSAGLWPSR